MNLFECLLDGNDLLRILMKICVFISLARSYHLVGEFKRKLSHSAYGICIILLHSDTPQISNVCVDFPWQSILRYNWKTWELFVKIHILPFGFSQGNAGVV